MAERLTPAEDAAVRESYDNTREAKQLINEVVGSKQDHESRVGQLDAFETIKAGAARALEANESHRAKFEEAFKDVLATARDKQSAYDAKAAALTADEDMEAYRALTAVGPDFTPEENTALIESERLQGENEKHARALDGESKRVIQVQEDAVGTGSALEMAQLREEANREQGQALSVEELPTLESAARKIMHKEQEQKIQGILGKNELANSSQRKDVDRAEEDRKSQADFAAGNQDVLEAEARRMMDDEFAKRVDSSQG